MECGSGTALIWLFRIRNQECGSGYGSKSKEIDKLEFQPFKKNFCTYIGMFYELLPSLSTVYFPFINFTFCDIKSDQDPDPHWFGALDPH